MTPVSSNSAAIGDAVVLLSGGDEMLVLDVQPGESGVIAGWKHTSGQVFESWFPIERLRLVRRMRSAG